MINGCNKSVNAFFTLSSSSSSSIWDEISFDAFHQTLGVPSSPPIPSSFQATNLNQILKPLQPIKRVDSNFTNSTQKISENKNNYCHIDLMSCTESLGLESSDEIISSFDDLGNFKNNSKSRTNEDFSSPSSPLLSSSSSCLRKKWEEKKFPPPITSLSENGRRNFVLKSDRRDGRLEIVRVMIERPEILISSRENGRLIMNLVSNDDDDYDCNDDDDDDYEYDYNDDDDKTEEIEEDEKKTEERGRKILALRRCFHHQRQISVWGPQQHRFVTTV
ncbi:uncharacterized protein LOC130797198 [Amaranthus tricolor]|uniref:uncharacterized protein LOC130797198 n=1 Tax=Amaranthus tricolor TaxID=29722 RepID=UPI002583714C|nr:uncharacterized protein LOC130797198 [Amaranthus tricolor]